MRFQEQSGASRASVVEIAQALINQFTAGQLFLDLQVRDHTAVVPWRASCTNASEELTIWQGRCQEADRSFAAKRPGAYRQVVKGDHWRFQ